MQGFNMGRYYPPPESTDNPQAPSTFNRSHPLRDRARKLRTQGILTVRFEMPFAVWCSTCTKPTIIGQGVRFNAEKKKVGNYHSTPIWQFRMRHAVCGGVIEIRTDPKATEYVVVEGGKRRDYGDERVESNGAVIDPDEKRRQREDAMANLEGKKDEEKIKKDSSKRIQEMVHERDRSWSDPYQANQLARKAFRKDRKEHARQNASADRLITRMGLDIEVLPESETDRLRARLTDFCKPASDAAAAATRSSLFAPDQPCMRSGKSQIERSKVAHDSAVPRRLGLGRIVHDNTRAAMDPFLSPAPTLAKNSRNTTTSAVAAVKHDRPEDKKQIHHPPTLVDYDSD